MLTLTEKTVRIFLIISLLWLFGCSEENPVNNKNKVTGTIYDNRMGFPVSGIIVSINKHQPFYLTQADGKFELDNSAYPYNLMTGSITMYKGLTIKNLNLSGDFGNNENRKTIWIKSPLAQKENERQTVIFLSDENNYNAYIPDINSIRLEVFYPILNSSIKGKIIYLSYITDFLGQIISYEHYGEKEITITNTSDDTVTFNENEISFNPPECDVNIDFKNETVNFSYTYMFLNFKNYNYHSTIYLTEFIDMPTGAINFKQPVLKNLTDIKASTFIRFYEGANLGEYRKDNYFDLCEGKSLVIPELEFLRYPDNYQSDVGRNTDFIFGNDDENCVYKLSITLDSIQGYRNTVRLYTSEKRVNLGELIDYGFYVPPMTLHYWNVIKYSGYNSIDEFASRHPFEKTEKTEVASPRRAFITGSLIKKGGDEPPLKKENDSPIQ